MTTIVIIVLLVVLAIALYYVYNEYFLKNSVVPRIFEKSDDETNEVLESFSVQDDVSDPDLVQIEQ